MPTFTVESQKEEIYCINDVLTMLDSLLLKDHAGHWWDRFYAERDKTVPFFVNFPDENLVHYFQEKLITPDRVLELGCGPGRNALYFAGQGCRVDAVDFSQVAIDWASERMNAAGVKINFTCGSIFDLQIEAGCFDIVYDSGCLHHIPPHRRPDYLALVNKALKPGGFLGLTCFASGCESEGGGTEISDWEVYRQRSLRGGQAFSQAKLERLFGEYFEIVELRRMREINGEQNVFGKAFLWAGLLKKL